MIERDVIAHLIRTQNMADLNLPHILSLSPNQLIENLIGLKGGFVYRAYMLERLMELTDGPCGLAVPIDLYQSAVEQTVAKE
ncbi:hypothetical protein [Effusibacillus dendaii]|uniref:Uncharacterized protein n=1 Tax=Effusibacillus dendaii TaxID=2743772 RepID=A0A7I8DBJ9_9BACL|nr:hypothetical protein [Effusibacillus dendaii]BCJ87454.1 hypothetical protein skT53_24390 [Effusibacillus dendaii]